MSPEMSHPYVHNPFRASSPGLQLAEGAGDAEVPSVAVGPGDGKLFSLKICDHCSTVVTFANADFGTPKTTVPVTRPWLSMVIVVLKAHPVNNVSPNEMASSLRIMTFCNF